MATLSAYAASPGTADTWNSATPLPSANYTNSSVAYNGYLYEMGGSDSPASFISTVNYTPLNSDGSIGAWNSTTPLPVGTGNAAAVAYNGYMYEIGGTGNGGPLINSVLYAPINANGTLGSWTHTTSLPLDSIEGANADVYNGYVYVVGGYAPDAGGAISVVYYAPINANGTLGSWAPTAALPDTNASGSSIVYNGYIYELGGLDQSGFADGVVDYAPINANGTLGSWAPTAVLPDDENQIYATSVVYNGYIFELGGYGTTGNLNNVYSAPINPDGTIGAWNPTTALPISSGVNEATSVVYNGYAYEIGGYGDSRLSSVYYSALTGFPSPTLVSDMTAKVIAGSSVTIDVLSGATGNPDPNSVSIITQPSHGTAVDPSGSIEYTPILGYTGPDSFTYQVCSLSDESLCSQATVNLTVVAGSAATVDAPSTGYGIPEQSNSAILGFMSMALASLAGGTTLLCRRK